jgi:hypothetical protein
LLNELIVSAFQGSPIVPANKKGNVGPPRPNFLPVAAAASSTASSGAASDAEPEGCFFVVVVFVSLFVERFAQKALLIRVAALVVVSVQKLSSLENLPLWKTNRRLSQK